MSEVDRNTCGRGLVRSSLELGKYFFELALHQEAGIIDQLARKAEALELSRLASQATSTVAVVVLDSFDNSTSHIRLHESLCPVETD